MTDLVLIQRFHMHLGFFCFIKSGKLAHFKFGSTSMLKGREGILAPNFQLLKYYGDTSIEGFV